MNNIIDIASFLHFFNFMILGIFFKNNYTIAFILGLVWEIIEIDIVKSKPFNYLTINYKRYNYLWNEKIENKMMDLIINMIGYYVGNQIKFDFLNPKTPHKRNKDGSLH